VNLTKKKKDNMKKKQSNVTISFSYGVSETPKAIAGGIEDAIASTLLAINAAEQGAKAMREELRGFIKDNAGAIKVEAIEAALEANGWKQQAISREMLAFGLRRRKASKAKAAESAKVQAKAQAEFAALRKRYSGKDLVAVARRVYLLAQKASK
jgi:hypothetical protein